MDHGDPNEPTFPCPLCGRKFIRSSLDKHEQACRKLATLHRKPFDSGKQRANGSDLTLAAIKKAQNEKAKNGGVFPRPQTNWRERHGNFIDAVSSSKRVDYALKTGAPLPPPPKTAVPSDYVQCEYCSRNFNAAAAERHIPFCREQATRKQGGSLKSSAGNRGLPTTSHRNVQTKHDGRKQESSSRNGSAERKTTTRGRDGSLSRARRDDSNDITSRRKSLETRSNLTTAQVVGRNTSLSAGMRPSLPPMTPTTKRSSSAKRESSSHQEPTTPQRRLKTPAARTTTAASRSGSRTPSRSRTRDESRESRLSQAKSNSRNNSRSRIF